MRGYQWAILCILFYCHLAEQSIQEVNSPFLTFEGDYLRKDVCYLVDFLSRFHLQFHYQH